MSLDSDKRDATSSVERPRPRRSYPSASPQCINSARQLIFGAYTDIKQQHNIFPSFGADRVLDYFDGVIGLVSVFLYEEIDVDQILAANEDPTALLLSLLCYFHVMVYWLNVHHFLKFSSNTFTILQVWFLFIASLGLVMYPLSLAAWIEKREEDANLVYIILNAAICFAILVFNCFTTVDERANDLFRFWHKFAPFAAFVYYTIALILRLLGVTQVVYMLNIAPFLFIFPLGAAKIDEERINCQQTVGAFYGASRDIMQRNILSPYSSDRVLDYFDAIVGLATVFLFIETLGIQNFNDVGLRSTGLLAALLCFFHVMVYWIVTHHELKFSTQHMSVISVWLCVLMSLGLVLYPLCLTVWLEGGSIDLYYEVNVIIIGVGNLFYFSVDMEEGKANHLYRLWKVIAPIIAFAWYSIALVLLKVGNEQRWMIVVAPIFFMIPLGGASISDLEEEVINENLADLGECDDEKKRRLSRTAPS